MERWESVITSLNGCSGVKSLRDISCLGSISNCNGSNTKATKPSIRTYLKSDAVPRLEHETAMSGNRRECYAPRMHARVDAAVAGNRGAEMILLLGSVQDQHANPYPSLSCLD
jgi:cellobiose phosphorylase